MRELFDRLDVRLVVGSRSRPSWATARAEIYGDLLEIGPDDLALTDRGKRGRACRDAPPLFAKDFLTKANGWPAVIGLAAVARSTRRTPRDAVSTTLFRFFAEELFAAVASRASERLCRDGAPSGSVARVDGGAVRRRCRSSARGRNQRKGFVTRERAASARTSSAYSRIPIRRRSPSTRRPTNASSDAVRSSLELEAWDNAFALITRFARVDLLTRFLSRRSCHSCASGRIGTLEHVADFARSRRPTFSPAVTTDRCGAGAP